MSMDESADEGCSFDKVFDLQHANKDTASHFVGGSMIVGSGDYEGGLDPLRPDPLALPKDELFPPPRPKRIAHELVRCTRPQIEGRKHECATSLSSQIQRNGFDGNSVQASERSL
ncbi:MAG: hypothetical protein SGPRY_013222, partial [Prymnesium sp.]